MRERKLRLRDSIAERIKQRVQPLLDQLQQIKDNKAAIGMFRLDSKHTFLWLIGFSIVTITHLQSPPYFSIYHLPLPRRFLLAAECWSINNRQKLIVEAKQEVRTSYERNIQRLPISYCFLITLYSTLYRITRHIVFPFPRLPGCQVSRRGR